MSHSGSESSETITAELRDGQLQIVEVSYDRSDESQDDGGEIILPDLDSDSSAQYCTLERSYEPSEKRQHYVQVVDPSGKGVMHLDLLNFTLIKCENDDQTEPQYKLVANASDDATEIGSSSSMTCILQSSDGEEQDGQDYVVVEGSEGPLLLRQSDLNKKTEVEKTEQKKPMTPAELIERAKLLQKARALTESSKRGRKRKEVLPPPHVLLASPNFKLFLYNCKFCSFKCNAIKELTEHRTKEHGTGSKWRLSSGGPGRGSSTMQCAKCPYRSSTYGQGGRTKEHGTGSKWRLSSGGPGRGSSTMQCAKCPYRSSTYGQFMKHLKEKHLNNSADNNYSLGTASTSSSAEPQQILVCGACGFESTSRVDFHDHVNKEHVNDA